MQREFDLNLGGDGHAVHVKLTQDLITSLREAQASGAQATIKFGAVKEPNVLTVGDVSLNFRSLPEDNCCVIAVPPPSHAAQDQDGAIGVPPPETSRVVATVHNKLQMIAQPQKRSSNKRPDTAQLLPQAKRVCIHLDAPPITQQQEQQQQLASKGRQPAPIHPPTIKPTNTKPSVSPEVTVSGGHSAGSTIIGSCSKLEVAARTGSLRLTLIALLANKPYGRLATIKAALERVAYQCPKLRVPENAADLEHAIKAVAVYKSPGRYVVLPGFEGELEALLANTTTAATGGGRGAAGFEVGSVSDGGSVPTTTMTTTATGIINNDQLVGGGREAEGGIAASVSMNYNDAKNGRRVSASGVESWIDDIVTRSPQLALDPIGSLEECEAKEKEAQEKYEAHFRLHQLLESNTRLFQDLLEEAEALQHNKQGVEQVKQQAQKLWAQRAHRVKQWSEAYHVLQAELEALKARIAEFRTLHEDI